MRAILIVLDSVGIGHAPDAREYGDEGAATLPHIAAAVGGLKLPTLESLGLGNILPMTGQPLSIPGVSPVERPLASFGAMQELSQGKDTITGHWEIGGLLLQPGFHLFPPGPPSFPKELVEEFERRTGRKMIGDKSASGVGIIDELGARSMQENCLDRLHQRRFRLPDRRQHRRDSAARALPRLRDRARAVRSVPRRSRHRPPVPRPAGRIPAHRGPARLRLPAGRTHHPGAPPPNRGAGLRGRQDRGHFRPSRHHESDHTGNNLASQKTTERFAREAQRGFIFANYIDFDMLYGHRRDPRGYAECLVQTDAWLKGFLPTTAPDDVLIITADHGNDPTYKGTDHTREIVPLLVYRPGRPGVTLGLRQGYFDIAQSSPTFRHRPLPRGQLPVTPESPTPGSYAPPMDHREETRRP
jgi:phosphopentomutase